MTWSILLAIAAPGLTLKPGLEIRASGNVRPGDYVIANRSGSLTTPVIKITGNNLTVDFQNAVLRGSRQDVEPDQRQGLGILVSGKNITVKNLRVHGYKVAVKAENCQNLTIVNSDFSYNWKQKLKSTLEKEDLDDWMSYHQNEKDEWLRYGAGLYLKNVNKFELKNINITGGQNGVLLMRSNKGRIWNSNFSFLSALGLGMYRSSDNEIKHNNIDWCVRGYSHGVYNRGQDSAGILIYEQSNRNVFAYNSVTHGGDGFFLWAGQTTMDTGKGGCNDNLVYGNDFSHAPTNGIEATFSRNKFVNNLLRECWHGFWTGYSYDTLIEGNTIENCEVGVAHEHGNGNTVRANVFQANATGIRLWANASQDPNWGYPKTRNTKSENWLIEDNLIFDKVPLNIIKTQNVKIQTNSLIGETLKLEAPGNRLSMVRNTVFLSDKSSGIPAEVETSGNQILDRAGSWLLPFWIPSSQQTQIKSAPSTAKNPLEPKWLKGGKFPFIDLTNTDPSVRRGRKYILVDEWGPYDFKSPKLWPGPVLSKPGEPKRQKFSIYGPKGSWKASSMQGVTLSATKGEVPGSVEVTYLDPKPEDKGYKIINLVYTGKAVTNYKGAVTRAGAPFAFTWSKFQLPIEWKAEFFLWDKDTQDPRTQSDAYEKAGGKTIATWTGDSLDFTGYGKFIPGLPASHFGSRAEGVVNLPKGEYTVDATADDGIRVWVDGKMVIDAWKYQGPTQYTAAVSLNGKHTIRVEHFQIDGYAALQVKLVPKR